MQFDSEKPDKITRGACGCNDDKVIFENPLNWTTRSKLNRRKGTLPVTTYRALELGFEGYFSKKLTTRVSYSAGAVPRAAAWPARGTTQNSFGPVAAL